MNTAGRTTMAVEQTRRANEDGACCGIDALERGRWTVRQGRMRVALVSMLVPLVVGCATNDGASAPEPFPSPASTVVSDTVSASASTARSQPVGIADALQAAVADGLGDFRGAVLVARGDDVLLSDGYGLADVKNGVPNEPTTRFRIASITKQFTGLAVLILREQGALEVTDSICDHLAPCPAAWQPITIEDLVAHTSGIPDFTELADYEATKALPTTPDDLVGRVRVLALERAPGSEFSYSNSNYAVLGAVIEGISGVSYENFLRTNVFDPLGMPDTGLETPADGLAVGYAVDDVEADQIHMSVPYAAGSLSSTVGDLLRWNLAIASGTAAPGEATVDMLTPIVVDTDMPGFEHGYGIYVSPKDEGPLAFADGGIDGFQSLLVNDVGNNITVVILSNTNDSGDLRSTAWALRAIVLAG